MSNTNSDGKEHTSIRVDRETARKLKALSGMDDKPIVEVVRDLVEEAFKTRVSEIASDPDNF